MAKLLLPYLQPQIRRQVAGVNYYAAGTSALARARQPTHHVSAPLALRQNADVIDSARHWAQLSPADQAAWNTLSATYPNNDSLGVPYHQTGYSSYVQAAGAARHTDAPFPPAPNPATLLPLPSWISMSYSPPSWMVINWTGPYDWPAGLNLYTSPEIGAPQLYPRSLSAVLLVNMHGQGPYIWSTPAYVSRCFWLAAFDELSGAHGTWAYFLYYPSHHSGPPVVP